ncbi:DUF2294 domain-containing protein [Leptolyngbya cf. ectocarpi LEGE 11479]|uniref:DUF2294 domain-containing protein n=1 Tax=Leptolyngbya cf. ectocarpi LEGE 11479 TaxID=1828722 RepID=A0A929FC51_LEPEC|nr:DUF2294 domain-containing protein [Leptolyngbya ectocarpi]MBE9069639.1 DUF2294 domain-containing protein [Leptolyngbya cf. ectocarpi LEGE 11479]
MQIATADSRISTMALPTVGELERDLSQKIQALYSQRLGQLPTKVICHLFGQNVVVILENCITHLEHFLFQQRASDLFLEVRKTVNQQIKQDISELIESVLDVHVTGILIDTSTELNQTGLIVALSDTPDARNRGLIPKTRAYKRARKRRNLAVECEKRLR